MYVLFVRHLIILNYLLNIFISLFVLWILLSISTYVLSIWYVLPIRYLLLCIYYSISLSMSTIDISIYVLSIRCLYICPTYSISSSLHYLLDISFFVPSIRYFLLFLFIRYLLFLDYLFDIFSDISSNLLQYLSDIPFCRRCLTI